MNDANHISVDHAETVKLKIYVYNRPNELKSAILEWTKYIYQKNTWQLCTLQSSMYACIY